jgi:ABC-2 type transport system permease protein
METVYTGEIATDLLKPMNFIAYWMARDLGRAVMQFIFRGLVLIAGYAFLFDLAYPQNFHQWLALGLAMIFSWILSFLWRFLINLAAFWTPQARGILRFFFTLSWFFSGFLMPIRFFPDWVIKLSYLTPFPHMLSTVIEIYLGVLQGPDLIQALAAQLSWIVALFLASQLALRAGVRRLVILGG